MNIVQIKYSHINRFSFFFVVFWYDSVLKQLCDERKTFPSARQGIFHTETWNVGVLELDTSRDDSEWLLADQHFCWIYFQDRSFADKHSVFRYIIGGYFILKYLWASQAFVRLYITDKLRCAHKTLPSAKYVRRTFRTHILPISQTVRTIFFLNNLHRKMQSPIHHFSYDDFMSYMLET